MPDVVDDAAHEAAEVVAKGARYGFPIGPGRHGHARDTIQATRRTNSWEVAGGGAAYPYYPWIDFGGTINEKWSPNVTTRPFFKKGRFIYPSYERHKNDIDRIMSRALVSHAEGVGLDVS